MRKYLAFSIILTMTLGFFAGTPSMAETPIKFAYLGNPDPHKAAYTAGVVSFVHLMEMGSGGRLQVKIFPAGTLGKETDILQALKSNAVQIISASMVTLSRIFPPSQVMMSPYLFKNDALAWEVADSPYAQKLLEAFTEETGIKALAIVDSGFLAITNNKRPLQTPSDFIGIRLRAMGPLQMTMYKALGASAVPIPWPETYASLQTGVADGQTNPAFVVATFKLYEVQKYMTLANSQFGYQMWLCNKAWYDGLPEDDKNIMRDAVKGGRMSTRSMSLLREQESLIQLKNEGMKISALTGEDVSALQKLVRPACLDWLRTQMDARWVDDLIAVINKAEKKLGYKAPSSRGNYMHHRRKLRLK